MTTSSSDIGIHCGLLGSSQGSSLKAQEVPAALLSPGVILTLYPLSSLLPSFPPSSQYHKHAGHEKRGVSSLEELSQAFKIAERAAPGFCNDLVKNTVTYLTSHSRKAHTH